MSARYERLELLCKLEFRLCGAPTRFARAAIVHQAREKLTRTFISRIEIKLLERFTVDGQIVAVLCSYNSYNVTSSHYFIVFESFSSPLRLRK